LEVYVRYRGVVKMFVDFGVVVRRESCIFVYPDVCAFER